MLGPREVRLGAQAPWVRRQTQGSFLASGGKTGLYPAPKLDLGM